jgi:hypothetical protein
MVKVDDTDMLCQSAQFCGNDLSLLVHKGNGPSTLKQKKQTWDSVQAVDLTIVTTKLN